MKKIGKLFIQGLAAILPIALTFYILYWLAASAESVLGGVIKFFMTDKYYIPGMGVAAGVLVIMGVGILMRVWVFNTIFKYGERLLERVPVVKSLYGSIRDLTNLFNASKKRQFNKVVMFKAAGRDVRMIGLVTREDFDNLPEGIGDDEIVAVYLPMSYQMGGYTVYVTKNNIEPVDMSIEEAMRFALTAGVSIKKNDIPMNQ